MIVKLKFAKLKDGTWTTYRDGYALQPYEVTTEKELEINITDEILDRKYVAYNLIPGPRTAA